MGLVAGQPRIANAGRQYGSFASAQNRGGPVLVGCVQRVVGSAG